MLDQDERRVSGWLLVVLSWAFALDLSTAAVTGAHSKPSGTPAAGGTSDLPPEGGDAEDDDELEEAPAVIGSPGS